MSNNPPSSPGEWEYEVTIKRVRYVVVISDEHAVQTVARLASGGDTFEGPRQIIWHKGSSNISREVGLAIEGARAIERKFSVDDLRAQLLARPDRFAYLSEEEKKSILSTESE